MRDGHLAALRAWLDASPAETLGLALLSSGALAVAALIWWTSLPRPAGDVPAPVAVPTAGPAADLTIHVTGAVHRPGVVSLPAGSRVTDAVDAAGGATADAVLGALNLARPLEDGERVLVPTASDVTSGDPDAPPVEEGRADGRVDLNRATPEELEALPGIGPVLASRIVQWREDNGPFTEVGELREVPGIGERTFQTLADLVAV